MVYKIILIGKLCLHALTNVYAVYSLLHDYTIATDDLIQLVD